MDYEKNVKKNPKFNNTIVNGMQKVSNKAFFDEE
jgi:hypothetical protein